MKKRILGVIVTVCIVVGAVIGITTIFATLGKAVTGGDLNKTITVYTADGKKLATYEGKIDIENNGGGYIKFDLNGKRYIYYNCFVETISEIN